MLKVYWSHSKNHLNKSYKLIRSGILLLICLIVLNIFTLSLQASPSLKYETIQKLEQQSKGDVQKRYRAWMKLMKTVAEKPIDVQLEQVNTFFNQFSYQSNLESKGITEHWKTPEEFIVAGGGDCKDYSIIKYFTMIYLGVPQDKLRLTYVIYLKKQQAHMVLSYYPSPELEPLILDNLEPKILKASKRPDLKPIYSFNGEGLWLAKQRVEGTSIGKPASLKKWGDLMQRMEQQGDKP